MLQFNNQYRLFFKKLNNASARAIVESDTRVLSFSVKRDLLTKATSSFTIVKVPSEVELGDIVGMYDFYGFIAYLGVVTLIEENTIEAAQIIEIFDDSWVWNNPRKATIEETLKTIFTNDYQNNVDTLLSAIFSPYTIVTTSQTQQTLASKEANYVTNMTDFLYSIYKSYGIIVDLNIPFEATSPSIVIGKSNQPILKLANNAAAFRNFNVTTEVFENNKLIIYNEDGTYRETWYASDDGIVDDPDAPGRIKKIKTNVVFSNDSSAILKAQNLRKNMYNHQISFDLVIDNKLLPFEKFKLGQEVEIYYNGKLYKSVLTGYEMSLDDGISNDSVKLIFGLVRTSLTSKLKMFYK